jgi:6-pyruvoyltetrahydropterin/6-carboxytetrahydropterin synthase
VVIAAVVTVAGVVAVVVVTAVAAVVAEATVVVAGGAVVAVAATARAQPRNHERPMRHRIVIAREQYKVSCAHMTVFADGTKERLHGHNYSIAIAIEVGSIAFADMVPFAPIKAALAELCAAWKEHVLIAANNPHLRILRDDAELEITLCGDRYVFPRGDVLVLPIDNISVEALSLHIAELLRDQLATAVAPHARSLEVTVEESPGQGASTTITF